MELNVLAEKLNKCSDDPATGFSRNGCCSNYKEDQGKHLVCVSITRAFLAYSKSVGNDLSTPMPQYNFPGLKDGDQWCLCAERWQQALEDGQAPSVRIRSTHINALEVCDLRDLLDHAIESF